MLNKVVKILVHLSFDFLKLIGLRVIRLILITNKNNPGKFYFEIKTSVQRSI